MSVLVCLTVVPILFDVTGVFKVPEVVDIFVDLKQIPELYTTVVSCDIMSFSFNYIIHSSA